MVWDPFSKLWTAGPGGRWFKVPHLDFESDVVFYERFKREERIGLRLYHPAIAKVLPCPERSRPYLVIEYVEGPSLRRVMKATGRMPLDFVLRVGRQLAGALAYMHREGVVHRDLKPENIVVDPNDGAHIIDFGIALDLSARRITWGRLSTRLGTPEYMAPEQIRGKRGDARVDVYALGHDLYEMLAHTSAYVVGNPIALLKTKLKEDPRPIRGVVPDVDPPVAAIIMRAIAREPSDRYASVDELLDALANPQASMVLAVVAAPRGPNLATRAVARAMAGIGMFCVLLLGLIWFVSRVR